MKMNLNYLKMGKTIRSTRRVQKSKRERGYEKTRTKKGVVSEKKEELTDAEIDEMFEKLTAEAAEAIRQTVNDLLTMEKEKAETIFKSAAPIYQDVVLSTFPELRVKFALNKYPIIRISDEKYLEVAFPSLHRVTGVLELIGVPSLSKMDDEKLKEFMEKVEGSIELMEKVCEKVYSNYEVGDVQFVPYATLEASVRDFFTASQARKFVSAARWRELESKLDYTRE